MKIALIGGGGFRAPIVWESIAAIAEDVPVEEVVLQDVSADRLARVGSVIEGLRRERGGGPFVRTTIDLTEAVDGADVVFCAIRVGGLRGRVIDESVPLREGVLGQETVGPGGISFALRTVPVMLEIADAVSERAPSSWFLNFTNPAGLVTEALRPVLGDKVVGICDSPAALFGRVATALGRLVHDLHFDYAGLNHLGWLLGLDDAGRDLLPGLLGDDRTLATIEETSLFGAQALKAEGLIPNEYVIYYHSPAAIVDSFRRAGETRAEVLIRAEATFYDSDPRDPPAALALWRRARDMRFGTYMAEVKDVRATGGPGVPAGDGSPQGPGESGYAAIAAAFLHAVASGSEEMLALNVANEGRLQFLEDDAVVEVTCAVTRDGPRPVGGRSLPPAQAETVARVKESERLTISAATTGRRELALEALSTHPVVGSFPVAQRILAGYLAAFPSLARQLR